MIRFDTRGKLNDIQIFQLDSSYFFAKGVRVADVVLQIKPHPSCGSIPIMETQN